FGLQHKGYNNTITGREHNYGFNGIEHEQSLGLDLYEMPLRQYDPAIARWTSIDPVTHHSMSTYTAFDNDPVFWADPSGANSTQEWMAANGITDDDLITVYEASDEEDDPQDDITVNSNGKVVGVVKNDKSNRFFDQDGNELFFNDYEGIDGLYNDDRLWEIGDRVFYAVSIKKVNNHIIESGLIYDRWFANLPINGPGKWLSSLFTAVGKGHGDFDFAEGFLSGLIDKPALNHGDGRRAGLSLTFEQGAGFFRFGNQSTIYNLYDAGNYMWGRAMGMSGFSYAEVIFGSNANELTSFSLDSDADQRAIKNGFNGN
ncbi:RHS repeat-associated core domain-containing protein, partial [Aquimarina sp. RZ0]|uniref:RHS repeat-associated core domain-containing protein n=1 Tax=Aquimarina sp. RZ0 TaxID=2607730 RepID=UPI002714E1E7